MRSRNLAFPLVIAAGLLLLFLWLKPSSSSAPSASSSMLAPPTALAGLDTNRGIQQFEQRVREDPRDFLSLTILGQLYERKARETSDLARFQQAEDAFRRALQLNPEHVPAKAMLASVFASQHKFLEALQVARELYDRSPSSIDALATVADAYLETGQYKEGGEAVRALTEKAGELPPILARRALVAELHGRTAEAVALLERAVARTRRDGDPAPEVAWYETRLGDVYFHSGCLAESERHFAAALELFSSYPVGLAGLADVRAAQGRLPEAADLYSRAIAQSPEPRRLFALGAIEERMGRTEEAKRHYQQGEEIARREVSRAAYYRDLSVFYAERLGKSADALALAEKDLAIRKDVRAYDTLAWALYRNRRFDEAAAAIGEALKLGTRDPNFAYHAGMIYEALGQTERSRQYLEQARQLTPRLNRSPSDSAAPPQPCQLQS